MHHRLGLEGADLPQGIQTVNEAHLAFPLYNAKRKNFPDKKLHM